MALCPRLSFSASFSFSVLSLYDMPTSTQSPTFCPSISSLLSLPPNGLVCLSLGLSHPYIGLTEDNLSITMSQETTNSISARHYLLQTLKTSLNRETPSPSPSSCFLNLRWRQLETNLIRWLTGSWFLELLRGGSREPFHRGSCKPIGLMDCWSRRESSQLLQTGKGLLPICTPRKGLHLSKEEGMKGWRLLHRKVSYTPC